MSNIETCHYCLKEKQVYKYGGKSEPICYDCCFPKQTPIVHNLPKQGRNAACPCGSGKKYKKCCL